MKNGKWIGRLLALMCTFLFVGTGIGLVAAQEEDGESEDIPEGVEVDFPDITLEKRTGVDVMGGGDFAGLVNEDRDAFIGILYGSEDNPNFPTIVSMYTRYLGTADVYDENGDLVEEDHAIPVVTLYGQQFWGLHEFNDWLNNNDYNDGYWNIFWEPVKKWSSLKTAWELTEDGDGPVENDDGTYSWDVSFTARDLPYMTPITDQPVAEGDVVEEVTIAFHLTFTKEFRSVNVPSYRVSVTGEDSDVTVTDVEYDEQRSYEGMSVGATFKYDHHIEGWDYESTSGDPSLMLSTGALFGNAITSTANEWMTRKVQETLLGDYNQASFEYEDQEGKTQVESQDRLKETDFGYTTDFEDPDSHEIATRAGVEGGDSEDEPETDEAPKMVRKNRLQFGDEWDRVGLLKWVNDVEVDGQPDEMKFQLMGGHLLKLHHKDWVFRGVWGAGSFIYPGGEVIVHDPEYTCDAQTLFVEGDGGAVDESGSSVNRGALLAIGLIAVVAVVVVIIVVFLLVKGDEKGPGNQNPPPDDYYYEGFYTDRPRR